ncbi:MAG TPA: MbcA/ParS/Xre antitoxin family protein [Anaerolineales bacterium]|jgi:hypothetical protein
MKRVLVPQPRQFSDAEKAGAGLRTFFNIAESRWHLSTLEQLSLLGQPGRATLDRWKKRARAGESFDIGRDKLDRLSYLMGIFKALNILYERQDLADRWLRAPNTHPAFAGATPLDFMVNGGGITELYKVRSLLDDWRGGWAS